MTTPPAPLPAPTAERVGPFTASKELADNLQSMLVDLLVLQLQAKQAHWTVVGRGFRSVHLQLDEIADAARKHSDVVAERMRAIHTVPDGRGGTIVKNTTLQPYPLGEIPVDQTIDLIGTRLTAVTTTGRRVHDSVEAEDPSSADELNTIVTDLERLNWMLQAEGR
jgi:starvation-inducible DNA-binding protein